MADLAAAGFKEQPTISTLAMRSRAESPRVPAIAYCQGTPLRGEIEARAASRLAEATDRAAHAIAARFGAGEVDGKIQAWSPPCDDHTRPALAPARKMITSLGLTPADTPS